jgi:hypothetical protein
MLNRSSNLNKTHNSVITYILCYVQYFMKDFLKTMKLILLFKRYSYDKRWLEIASSLFMWFTILMIGMLFYCT